MVIISARVEWIAAQMRAQEEEIGAPFVEKLGDFSIVTPHYIDL